MSTIVDKNSIHLAGSVLASDEQSFEDGFSSVDVFYALAGFDEKAAITVFINSPGGIATEGAAIYAMLKSRPGRVDVVIEGIAASAASLIAMAGKKVTMSAGSVMMIHDPAGFTFGNSKDHSKTIDALEVLATAYARVYAAKSGKTAEACREIMVEETWFTPEQAVEAGFADATSSKNSPVVAAFNYRQFRNAPEKLVALAASQNWGSSNPSKAQKPPKSKEKTMSIDAANAVKARLKAIMKADAAEGREALAEHLAFETEMSAEDAIALMNAAPQGSTERSEPEYVPPRRMMSAQDLNRVGFHEKPSGGGKLVANMKRRNGIK
ncbi:Clp protease ClpP [Rhizobium pusense]|uniref:head maturation protease, ClpP-related n=1 Tax=Rhizobium/Agrobacterium group TaxID=227290 RepID=UPI000D1B2F54|nr:MULTISPECIES: head maturation protease, ClpP-related [Rhizobium/Agrobacterium group]MDH0910658.1 Clp protease ClpP [Agrobacterium pusense]MDH1095586.1 Clp protease ClpP [Agrobacterium pusense]MDH1113236.1 Clp protease ClpP [Agrobacterium pusense]MDH2192930.1 Clp protease ClpP [Agrobacterium pusense]CAD7057973.1 Clp protease ClpP [Rhizobium sp. P007]